MGGPENVRHAAFDFHAGRVGHGYAVADGQQEELLASLVRQGLHFEVGRCFLLWDPWDGEVGNATNGNGRVGSNWYSRSHRKLWQESKADTQGNPPVRYAPPLPKRRVRGGMRPRKNRRGQSTQCGACWKLELRSPSTRTIPRCSLPL